MCTFTSSLVTRSPTRTFLAEMCIEVLRQATRAELEDITYNVSNRRIRWLWRNGQLKNEAPDSDPTIMEACLHGSVGIGSLAALSHRRQTRRVIGENSRFRFRSRQIRQCEQK
jgi:hypothetical protein